MRRKIAPKPPGRSGNPHNAPRDDRCGRERPYAQASGCRGQDSALVTAGAELRLVNGLSLAAKFDGEFAEHSQTYAGTGTLRYRW
jgi:hypothetical protein